MEAYQLAQAGIGEKQAEAIRELAREEIAKSRASEAAEELAEIREEEENESPDPTDPP